MAKDLARRALVGLATVGLTGLGAVAFAPQAHAAGTTIIVNTTTDETTVDGNCSLREALQAANTDNAVDACPAGSGSDLIQLAGASYVLAHGPLEVTSAVTIQGDFVRTLIDANAHCCSASRAVHVNSGADLTLDGVSIQHAAPAIRNDGTLDMEHGNLDTNLASWPNSDHSNGISNFGAAVFRPDNVRYTTNAVYNAAGANLLLGGLFDHDPAIGGANATIWNLGNMNAGGSFVRDITCTCSSRVIVNEAGAAFDGTNIPFVENAGIAVFANAGIATLQNAYFKHNTSLPVENSGALHLAQGRMTTDRVAHARPGAILNDGGLLSASNMTLDHNVGDVSGGIDNIGSGRVTLTNDTIARNAARFDSASGASGALPSGALTNADGTTMIRDTTIVGNTAVGFHDWRWHAGGLVTMRHGYTALTDSILSDNTAAAPVQSQDCFGPIHSLGYNLVEDATDCFIGADTTGNIIGVSAHLGALAPDNGFWTMVPPWDSPAVDMGNPATPNDADATACATIDERYASRPRDGNADGISRCDIGAVEHPG